MKALEARPANQDLDMWDLDSLDRARAEGTESENEDESDIESLNPENDGLRAAMADVVAAEGFVIAEDDRESSTSGGDVGIDEPWELDDDDAVQPERLHFARLVRPVAPLVEGPPRALTVPLQRRERRLFPKIEVGSWQGRSLYVNLSQTYGVWWHDMRAVCLRHSGTCMLSRSCRSSRPIGLLVGWLLHGLQPECATKQMHRAFSPNHAQRLAARELFRGLAGSEQWFAAEAAAEDGPEEPLDP